MQFDAAFPVFLLIELGYLFRHHAAHDAVKHLDDSDIEAELGSHGGNFQANVPWADNDKASARPELFPNRVDVPDRSKVMNAG